MKRHVPLLSLIMIVAAFSVGVANQSKQSRLHIAQSHLERARELEISNNSGAEREYRKAINALRGVYPEALRELSLYYQRRLRFSESLDALKQYISQTPSENHTDHIEEAEELARAAHLKERIEVTEKPMLQDLIDYSLLVSRYGENQFKDASPYAEAAVRLYSTSPEAHLALARILIGPGQEERRCAAINEAIILGSLSPDAYYQRGNCELMVRRIESAIQAFHKALEISNGHFIDAWQGIGWALSLQGQNKEAISAFRTYLDSGNVAEHSRIQIERKIKTLEGNQ